MFKPVNTDEIKRERKSKSAPFATEAAPTSLPLNKLDDRSFEMLIYEMFKSEIANREHDNMDDVVLMQGVGERGRDSVAYKNGKVSAIIQCKKYKEKITKPKLLKEIIKFLLHLTLDPDLAEKERIRYLFFTSGKLNEPAKKLVAQFPNEINKEISEGEIKKHIETVIGEYHSFEKYCESPPFDEIENLLNAMILEVQEENDIVSRLSRHPNVVRMFFRIQSIIDIGLFKEVMQDINNEKENIDIQLLKSRISNSPCKKNMHFGSFDLYGYDKKFLTSFNKEDREQLFSLIYQIKNFMNEKLFLFMRDKVSELTFEKITKNLIHTGAIHPYTVNVITMFLVKTLSKPIIQGSFPNDSHRKYYPEHFKSDEELIKEITKELVISSVKYLNGDYSQIKGSPEEVNYKINSMMPYLHKGLYNEEDIKKQVKRDVSISKPFIDEIKNEIYEILDHEKTIIIKDCFLDQDSEMIDKIKETFESFN